MAFICSMNVKTLLLLVGLTALNLACSRPKEPELVRIKSLTVQEFTDKNVVLEAEAILLNPNSIGVTVKEIDVSVTVDEKAVGKVNQTGEIKVPAKSEFEVPLVIEFAPQDVYDNLLSGLISFIGKGEIPVHYQGHIKMKAAGINFKVPIDHKDQVKF